MLGPQLCGPARRMEGIAEAEQAGDAARVEQLIRHHAGDTATHGLAADDQRTVGGAEIIHRGDDIRA